MNTKFKDNSDIETASIRKPEWIKPELIQLHGNDTDGKASTRSSERFPTVGPS